MLFSRFPSAIKNALNPHKITPAGISTAIPPPPPPPDTHSKPLTLRNRASALALFALAFTFIPAHHAQAQVDLMPTFGSQTFPDQLFTQNKPITPVTLPEASGGDPPLIYGSFDFGALTGLAFDSDTRVLSGIPTFSSSNIGNPAVQYFAEDADGDFELLIFRVGTEPDTTPTFGTATIPPQNYIDNTNVGTITLPTATNGNRALTYTLTPALPANLIFDGTATPPTITGTPAAITTQADYTYTVTDDDGSTAALTFALEVTAAPLIFDATIRRQRYAPDEPISVTLPAATGGDGALTYAITETLPAGLTFTPATRVLDGTPTIEQDAVEYTYTVTDMDPAGANTAQQTFTIAIGQFDTFGNVNRTILPEVTRAMMDTTVSAIARRTEHAATDHDASAGATFSLGGQSTLAGALQANQAALTTGAFNVKSLLGRSAFALPLNQAGGPLAGVTLWGNGAYRNLSGNSATVDWDGDLFGATVGGDTWLTDTLLTGLAVSWADGTFDYTDNSGTDPAPGTYQATLTSLHPYVSTSLLDGQVTLWATGGYGWGEVEITDTADPTAEGTVTADTRLATAAVGGAGRLLNQPGLLTPDGTTTVRVKAEVLTTAIKAEQQGDRLAGLTTDARRLRLTLEGSHEQPLPHGAHLTPSVGVGLRHDAGDGRTGTGAELSGGLRYAHPALRLTMESRGRVLLAHGGDYDDWSVSGRVTLAPGAQGQGLAVTLVPTYQTTTSASGLAQLWEHGTANRPAPSGPTTPQGLMDATVAYGLPVGDHLLTPYGGMTLGAADARTYRLGSRVSLAHRLNMSLEGARKGATGTIPVDHGVRVQLEWHW